MTNLNTFLLKQYKTLLLLILGSVGVLKSQSNLIYFQSYKKVPQSNLEYIYLYDSAINFYTLGFKKNGVKTGLWFYFKGQNVDSYSVHTIGGRAYGNPSHKPRISYSVREVSIDSNSYYPIYGFSSFIWDFYGHDVGFSGSIDKVQGVNEIYRYKDSFIEGPALFKNDQYFFHCNFDSGLIHGYAYSYHQNGQLYSAVYYNHGVLDSVSMFFVQSDSVKLRYSNGTFVNSMGRSKRLLHIENRKNLKLFVPNQKILTDYFPYSNGYRYFYGYRR